MNMQNAIPNTVMFRSIVAPPYAARMRSSYTRVLGETEDDTRRWRIGIKSNRIDFIARKSSTAQCDLGESKM